MKRRASLLLLLPLLGLFLTSCAARAVQDTGGSRNATSQEITYREEDMETIYLAGGCFWGVQKF
ncbi:MAG: hypothetical protein IJ708_01770, partial [Clostridia bacterium]|nr:hypothetical protein [Clostridia bacterium]